MITSSTTAFAMYLTFYLALTILSALWIFSIISRYCRGSSLSNSNPGPTTVVVLLSTNQDLQRAGLDTSVIDTFPMFAYTDMDMNMDTNLRVKMTGECVVCLGVFEGSEMLRLLPKCGHVFHADCVDAWLRSHSTCPFCRANLLATDSPDEIIIDVHHQQQT